MGRCGVGERLTLASYLLCAGFKFLYHAVFKYGLRQISSVIRCASFVQAIAELQDRGASPQAVKQALCSVLKLPPNQVRG